MDFFVEAAIGCFVSLIGCYYVSKTIFENKKKINLKSIIIMILSSIIITLINLYTNESLNKILKILLVYISLNILNKINNTRKLSDTIIGSTIVYINLFLSEVLTVIVLMILGKIINYELVNILTYSFLANFLTMICNVLIIIPLKRIYLKLLKNIDYYDKSLLISNIIILLILAILVTRVPIQNWDLNFDFITTMSLIILFSFIGIFLIKQRKDIEISKKEYIKLEDYSKINEMILEDYRVNIHESKNQLIIIDSMVPKKYKEVHEYIGNLIKYKNNDKYYWFSDLKYIPLSELKSFINIKFMEMINDKIKLEINISKDIDKNFFNKFKIKDKEDLYNIIGILLDNAHEAAMKSKRKEVSLQIYKANKKINIIVANTFKGKINLDEIDNYGYSSKGTNRGTGLHIIKNIISKNKKFTKETRIIDKYFVQSIFIEK